MKIAIIDYGMGNLKSVQKAFVSIGLEAVVTSNPKEIQGADKVVLPGVGAFRDAIHELNTTGLTEVIKEAVKSGKPFLGICLGMQLLFDKSYEYGEYTGLQILPGEIVKFRDEDMKNSSGDQLKVPHIGWNNLEIHKEEPLFKGVEQGASVYFVHSYYLQTKADLVSAYTTYGTQIAVAVQKDNVFAAQFHPEKSGEVGIQILKNFGGIKA